MKNNKGFKFYIIFFLALILFVLFAQNMDREPVMSYSNLLGYLKNEINNFKSITQTGDSLIVEFVNAPNSEKENSTSTKYKVYIPSINKFYDEVIPSVKEKGISFKSKPEENNFWWLDLVSAILIIPLFIILIIFLFRQPKGGGGNIMSFGKSRAKMTNDNRGKVNFNDVAGNDEEKEELAEIVEFLKSPTKFSELGARIPKGVLLVGPPGTGKTLLARAVSGEAGVPFFSISGSDFVEMFVGVGASRVRDLFEQAKKNAPCIVFIDEIDAVGRHRGAGLGGGHDEREQTLNQLLVEMDGFGVNAGVIILAATNRPDILDPALLRPGRFDRRVLVGLPDIKGREEILQVHSKNKPLGSDVVLSDIAKITVGFTGADLENLLNESALLAVRKNKTRINTEDLKEAIFKLMVGNEKKGRPISDKEKKLTAYHEAGHAIAVKIVSTKTKVDRISIIPSAKAGGYTAHRPESDLNYETKNQLIEGIIIALGGRAAEEIVLGEISTGAYGDLKHANGIARNMITKYGMSDTLGNMIFSAENDEVFIGRDFGHTRNYSEEIAAKIDKEVKSIIDSAYKKVIDILNENIEYLHKLANLLIEKEKIEGEEFNALFENKTIE